MRELKFRVWFENVKRGREINGELVFGIESYYDYDPVIDNNGLLDVEAGWDIQGHSDEKYVIEQYTGLKDKNGKEIYEGDIVKLVGDIADNKCRLYQVYYRKYKARYWLMPLEVFKSDVGVFEEAEMSERYEVVGNIHENPEQAKGEK